MEFPGQVVHVLQPAVCPARPERRHQVGGIAGKDGAAMDEFFHAAALEGVQAHPLVLEFKVGTEEGADLGVDILLLHHLLAVDVPAHLEIDAPDVIGLLVDQRSLAGVERRVEPEAPDRGEVRFHAHVGNQEVVLEYPAHEIQSQGLPYRAAMPVRGDQVIATEPVFPCGGVHGHDDLVSVIDDTGYLVLPADTGLRVLREQVDQVFFRIELLQVDERGEFLFLVRQQVKFVDRLGLLAEIDPALVPHHAFFHHAPADADAIQDLQRAFRPAYRARTVTHGVVFLQHHGADTVARQVYGARQADGTAACDDHREMGYLPGIDPGGPDKFIHAPRLAAGLPGLAYIAVLSHGLILAVIAGRLNMPAIPRNNTGTGLHGKKKARSAGQTLRAINALTAIVGGKVLVN